MMLIVRQIGRLVRVTRAAANIQLKLVPFPTITHYG